MGTTVGNKVCNPELARTSDHDAKQQAKLFSCKHLFHSDIAGSSANEATIKTRKKPFLPSLSRKQEWRITA